MQNTEPCNLSIFLKTQILHANRSTADLNHICHFHHYPNPHEWRGDTKALWSGFIKMTRKTLQTNLKYKCKKKTKTKNKSNNSKSRFWPKHEHSYSLPVRINQYTNEHVVITPWYKMSHTEREAKFESKRALQCSCCHP